MSSQESNGLLLLFPGFNTLDVNGPIEILKKSGYSTIFNIKVASETETTESVECVKIQVGIPETISHWSEIEPRAPFVSIPR
jgi:putative intracellular protease/amidase